MNNRIKLIFFGLITCILISSCKKDNSTNAGSGPCTTCASTPTALAANNNISKGIYKGVVVGSSGTIIIDIENSSSTMTGTMIIDGQTVALTTTYTYVDGQSIYPIFTGTLNNQPVTLAFSTNYYGGNPNINVTGTSIPGHPNSMITIDKELSTSLIKSFEGTFTGTSTGVFNMVLNTSTTGWKILAKDNTHTNISLVSGTLSGTTLSCSSCLGGDVTVTGAMDGDNTSGNWSDNSGGSGTWTGKRTQ